MAGGSTGKARFFTLRQCPDCMCDLPHRRELDVFFAENKRIPEIGIMIRKYFPSDRPIRCDLTKAWPARQHLLMPRPGPPGDRSDPGTTGFPLRNRAMAAL